MFDVSKFREAHRVTFRSAWERDGRVNSEKRLCQVHPMFVSADQRALEMNSFPISAKRIVFPGVAAVMIIVIGSTGADAQSGSGGCRRNGGGPNQGMNGMPPQGMGMPNGGNPQNTGFGPGGGPGRGPVAGSGPPSRRAMMAQQQQANIARIRERQAAIKAANASRNKTKSAKPAISTGPTAATLLRKTDIWIS